MKGRYVEIYPYNAENAKSLLGGDHSPDFKKKHDSTLVATAWEITRYLQTSSKRIRSSPSKVAMTIVVNAIWAMSKEDSAWTPEACALAVISATTSWSHQAADDDSTAIITAARSRITESLKPDSSWETLWSQAALLGEAANFRLEVEAAQARLLWEQLLVLSVDTSQIFITESPPSKAGLSRIRDKLDVTTEDKLTEIHAVYAAETTEYKLLDQAADYSEISERFSEHDLNLEWMALPPSDKDSDAHRVKVWFGTNREPISPLNPNSTFSSRLTDSLRYGVCTVNVSKVEDATGGALRFATAWLRLGNSKRASKVDTYYTFNDKRTFLAALKTEAAASPDERKGLLYVHGFNTNFSQAAISAADFSAAIKHRGPTAMFSWASAGSLFKYKQDSDTINKSRQHLIEFLKAFTSQASLDSVDIIAHSMGNRLVLRALKDWAENTPPAKTPIRNIYLGAPDVAQTEFVKKSSNFNSMAKKTTLYISDSDSALRLSRLKNRNHRVGLMRPLTVLPAIDTIETSNIDTSRLRHEYITEAPALRSDVFFVQEGQLDPNLRPNLDAVTAASISTAAVPQEYWRFVN